MQCEMLGIELNITCTNKVIICFKSGIPLNSIGIIQVFISISTTNFHIVDILTSFFRYLKNLDILSIYLNNIINQLICQNGINILIFCKWKHLWFFIHKNNKIAASIHLTKAKLCQVHNCFRHLLVNKLYKLLPQTGHDIEYKTIKMIDKFCYYCQNKGKAPQHFKFTLKKDIDFNYKIIINIIYPDGKPVFHTIDATIAF